MREITTTIYEYDELDEDAKEKARQWYLTIGLDYEWWDAACEEIKTIAALFGLVIDDIWSTGFYHQGQGSSFDGTYAYKPGCLQAVQSYAPEDTKLHTIVTELVDIQKRHNYKLSTHIKSRRETAIDVDEDALAEPLEAFNDWIFERLRDEYEYLTSDDQIAEAIRANSYEFTKTGVLA